LFRAAGLLRFAAIRPSFLIIKAIDMSDLPSNQSSRGNMKEENRKLIKDLLDNSSSLAEDIFDDSQEMLGLVPFILNIMAKRPAFLIFSSLKDFYALRPKSCLRVHMQAAEHAGASKDEILDAIFIAAVIGQSKVLASSLRAFQRFNEKVDEKSID